MAKRRRFSPEQKAAIVRRHLASKEPVSDLADEFVLEQAGEYRLAKPLIQEYRMPFRPSGNPEGVAREARNMGVRKGCDLVLVLDTGPWLGKQRSWKSRMKDHGYALVSIGQRIAVEP